jgi:hypothetical protein
MSALEILDKIEDAVIAAAAVEVGIMLLPIVILDAVVSIARKHRVTA